jgi:hypothetical protein
MRPGYQHRSASGPSDALAPLTRFAGAGLESVLVAKRGGAHAGPKFLVPLAGRAFYQHRGGANPLRHTVRFHRTATNSNALVREACRRRFGFERSRAQRIDSHLGSRFVRSLVFHRVQRPLDELLAHIEPSKRAVDLRFKIFYPDGPLRARTLPFCTAIVHIVQKRLLFHIGNRDSAGRASVLVLGGKLLLAD